MSIRLIIISLVLIIISILFGLIFLLFPIPHKAERPVVEKRVTPPYESKTASLTQQVLSPPPTHVSGFTEAKPPVKADSPTPPEVPGSEKDIIISRVREAATTYDPNFLVQIAPYLNSPDAQIRSEAVNSVVTLGDAAGAPLLRAQALRESDEQRKKDLLELADWLELPPAELVIKKTK
jgi:hypothetical protein